MFIHRTALFRDTTWVLCAALLIGFAGWGRHGAHPPRCPTLVKLKTVNPETTALIELRLKQAARQRKALKIHFAWTPLSGISPHLKNAVISAEDSGFYGHHGVEWGLLRAAFMENWRRGRRARGASTLCQQVARNLYLSPRKSYWRKAREILIALQMDWALPKNRILEIYLNIAEWGEGVFGAEAASRLYFGKQAASLSLDEAVSLAAVLPSPRRHHPGDGSRWVSLRKEWVYRRMAQCGRLPEAPPASIDLEQKESPPVPPPEEGETEGDDYPLREN